MTPWLIRTRNATLVGFEEEKRQCRLWLIQKIEPLAKEAIQKKRQEGFTVRLFMQGSAPRTRI